MLTAKYSSPFSSFICQVKKKMGAVYSIPPPFSSSIFLCLLRGFIVFCSTIFDGSVAPKLRESVVRWFDSPVRRIYGALLAVVKVTTTARRSVFGARSSGNLSIEIEMAFLLTVMGWVGETVIKNLIDKVWDKMKELGSQTGEGGVGDALSHLEISLIKIQPTISRAENVWIKDENLRQNVNKLLVLLKDAAYDAEDLLDKFHFQTLQQQIKQQGNEGSDASSSSSLSCLSRPIKKRKVGEDNDYDVVTEIRKIQEKLDNINIALEKLLSSDNRGKMQMINEINRVTSSIPVETHMFGRDNELNELIRLLLEPSLDGSGSGSGPEFGSSYNIPVLSITGMGGIGKTTLAQQAYNDKRVKEYFKLMIWVCVSEDFSVERLSKEIIESATGGKCDRLNFDALQLDLKKYITSTKFLLVLDDVWNKDKCRWDRFCAPLRLGVMGSKILVTTRDVMIANMISSVNPIHLDGLDNDNYWAFFKKCAFGSQNSRDHPQLEAIAKEMVPKLKGLPLAARTLGGLLNMNMDKQHWKKIMDSEIWKLPQEENGVLLVLQLSYQYLPAHLKRCFAFCSLYPKGYEFREDVMVQIWMAEGFFPTQENITMEDFGSGCFQELVSRSFFQKLPYSDAYMMHDLIHDLAWFISGGETCRLEDGKPFEIPAMLRHLNVMHIKDDRELRRMVELHGLSKLRTLICQRQHSFINFVLTCGLFNRLQGIHTLILKGCGLIEFPESIGGFIHLRYLDISWNSNITELPNSLFKLYNLQALILESCDLHELPDSIGDLICLRYLDISLNLYLNKLPESLCCLSNLQTLRLGECYRLQSLPQGMSMLTNLRKLDAERNLISEITGAGKLVNLQSHNLNFKVGKEHGHKLAELGALNLHGTLRIMSLENVESKEEAIAAKLQSKVHLDELVLQWTTNQEDDALFVSEEVLENVQPNPTLRELAIMGYNGARPPSWLEVESLPKLKTLVLQDCKRWDDLSFIRNLSHFKSLLLSGTPAVEQVSQVSFGSMESNLFLKLRELVLEDMTLLEELPILLLGQIPSLEVLLIEGLTSVEKITPGFFGPKNKCKCLPMLKELKISNMPVCQVWSCVEGREWFPCLSVLEIYNCPLIKRFPRLPPSLSRLMLNQVGLMEFPGIQEGTGGSSNNMPLPRLVIEISDCPNLTSLDRIGCFPCLSSLRINNCQLLIRLPPLPPSLTGLQLTHVGLTELPESQEGIGGNGSNIATVSLSRLQICECPNLTSLDQIECFPSLCFLEIDYCPLLTRLSPFPPLTDPQLTHIGLTELPGTHEGIGGNSSSVTTKSLSMLRLRKCANLTNLDLIECFSCLSVLEIVDYPMLTRLPPLSPSLRELKLTQVGLIELPGIRGNSSNIKTLSLSTLHIEECSNMISLEQGLLSDNLPNLASIFVKNCRELLSIPVKKFKEFTHLRSLLIDNCPKLMSIAQDDDIHFLLPPSMEKLELSNCGRLGKSLPGCLHNLTTLATLKVCDCPYLVSFAREPLLHLQQLSTLYLLNCNELRSLEELGIVKSLKTLKIHGCPRLLLNKGDEQGEGFSRVILYIDNTALLKVSPLRNMLPSIECLQIKSSPEVNMFEEKDQELLRSLRSLKYLLFYDCKNLRSLPKELHALPSLELLDINECAQIQSLPKKGLPMSLTDLHFNNCHSTLEKQLEEHLTEIKNSGRFCKISSCR